MADLTPSQETETTTTATSTTATSTTPATTETTVAGATSTEKTFTQADVDKIVADRLAREKKKIADDAAETTKKLEALETRINSQLATEALKSAGWRDDRVAVALKMMDLTSPDTYTAQVKKLIEEMPEFKVKAPQTRVKTPTVEGTGGEDDLGNLSMEAYIAKRQKASKK